MLLLFLLPHKSVLCVLVSEGEEADSSNEWLVELSAKAEDKLAKLCLRVLRFFTKIETSTSSWWLDNRGRRE